MDYIESLSKELMSTLYNWVGPTSKIPHVQMKKKLRMQVQALNYLQPLVYLRHPFLFLLP